MYGLKFDIECANDHNAQLHSVRDVWIEILRQLSRFENDKLHLAVDVWVEMDIDLKRVEKRLVTVRSGCMG